MHMRTCTHTHTHTHTRTHTVRSHIMKYITLMHKIMSEEKCLTFKKGSFIKNKMNFVFILAVTFKQSMTICSL